MSVSISVAFGCPFEGAVDPARVLELAARCVDAGAEEVVFADTIGVAVPRQVKHLVAEGAKRLPRVGIHLHNTRNTGFASAYAALEAGATVFEASVGGLGGCPFAPLTRAKDVTLHAELTDGLIASVDRAALHQILLNLLNKTQASIL